MKIKNLAFFCSIILSVFSTCLVLAQNEFGNLPQFLKREHFVIYHNNRVLANSLSWKAEHYYKKILRHFNVKDFDPFSDEPCPIYLYRTSKNYIENTGAPFWSAGIAMFEPLSFATYEKAKNLEDTTLPHELTHLLLFSLMGTRSIPLWLNEGLAQYEEWDFSRANKSCLKRRVRNNTYFKLKDLFKMQNYPEDMEDLRLLYIESSYVIKFLKKKEVGQAFGEFLLLIKKGVDVETALKEVYPIEFGEDFEEFENRWIDFVKRD